MDLTFFDNYPLPLLVGFLLSAAVFEAFFEFRKCNAGNRGRNFFIALITLALTFLVSTRHQGGSTVPLLLSSEVRLIAHISFDSAEAFCVCMALLFLFAILVAPRHVLQYTSFSLILLAQALIVLISHAYSMDLFLPAIAALLFLTLRLHKQDSESVRGDARGELRMRIFRRYQGAALSLLVLCGFLRVFEPFIPGEFTSTLLGIDIVCLLLSSSLLMGLFPFHSWVVPFIGAPRQTIFGPLICIQTAILVFFRIYAPLVERLSEYTYVFLVFPAVGLLYSALLFFGEDRLKRIPGHLYLSHISLMALSVIGLGKIGVTASMLDSVNVMIATAGLLAVCSLLTARLGVAGVLKPKGLASSFPELGVCYLICALSLVGFPGTLGFTEEEVMLGQGIEHHVPLVIVVALGLTLNGFSAFRLFARLFYGQAGTSTDNGLALLTREKVAIFALLAVIILNGIAPSFIVELYKSFGHAMHG